MNNKFEEELKNIKPRGMTDGEKYSMWSKIVSTINTQEKKTSGEKKIWPSFGILNMKIAISAVVFVFVLSSSSITAVLANDAVPGDRLFPIDIAFEKIRLVFAIREENKNKLRLSFSEERLNEAKIAFYDLNENTQVFNLSSESAQNNNKDQEGEESNSVNIESTVANSKFIDVVDIDKIKKREKVLSVAIDNIEKNKTALIESGSAGDLDRLESIISELEGLADEHLSDIDNAKIVLSKKGDGEPNIKIELEKAEEEIKTKLKYSRNKNGGSLSIVEKKEDKDDDEEDEGEDYDKKDNHKKDRKGGRDDDDDNDKKKNNRKIIVCHKGKEVEVSTYAWWAHSWHGDKKGECEDSNDDDDNATTTPDITGPTISDIGVLATTTEATIKWNTDEDATSSVLYSSTSPVEIGDYEKSISGFRKEHSMEIDNLTSSTTYYFLIRSEDESGNNSTSTEREFATVAITEDEPEDTTPPVISDINIGDISSTTAQISWSTDEIATSTVWYSLVSPTETSSTTPFMSNNNLVLNHNFEITGLTSSSTYFYIISSSDENGNEEKSSEDSFSTL